MINLSEYNIVDYTVLIAGNKESLNLKIKQHLAKGWVPAGPFVATEYQRFQPMAKIEPKFSERD